MPLINLFVIMDWHTQRKLGGHSCQVYTQPKSWEMSSKFERVKSKFVGRQKVR